MRGGGDAAEALGVQEGDGLGRGRGARRAVRDGHRHRDGDGDGDGEVYAVGNRDPFSGADVIADGIMGSRDGVPVVASPMHKQEFDLRTGACLDDPEVSLPVLPVPRA
ncbi:nitrite reductase (NAD(P)H) small subunit [Streptomyces sp. NPDC056501]|uniref:nitrite reductase (NAD(P)H) small subunit n=1 Tax=Streptomyces sp. NPDC056501 TaxID=3345841 RepID=UPI00369A223A